MKHLCLLILFAVFFNITGFSQGKRNRTVRYSEEEIVKLSEYIKGLEKKDSLYNVLQANYTELNNELTKVKNVASATPSESVTSNASNTSSPIAKNYYVQVGAYSSAANANIQLKKVKAIDPNQSANVSQETVKGKVVYRVVSGKFSDQATAESYRSKLASKGIIGVLKAESNEPVDKKLLELLLEGYAKYIYFDLNAATLKPGFSSSLDKVAEILIISNADFIIEGHADKSGPEPWNQELSKQRANTVKEYLISKGISASRLTAKGYGSSNPVATNDSEEGRAKNRVVAIKPIN